MMAAALLTACSEVRYVHEPPPAEPATSAAPTEPEKDAAPTEPEKDASSPEPPGTCPAPPPLSDPAWKEPPMPRDVCTAADLSYIAGISGPTATYQDVADKLASRNAACSECVFSHDVDVAWGPIVFVGPATKGRAFVNMGACFARVEGGSMTCGRVMQQMQLCVESVCDETACADNDKRQLCAKDTASNPNECGRYDVNRACGGASSYSSLVTVCRTGFDVIRALCGGKE